jgi:hypothetical protein
LRAPSTPCPLLDRAAPGAAAVGLLLSLAACVEPEADLGADSSEPKPRIAELTIDSGAAVALDAGAGIGVAVEYAGLGAWALNVACDTLVSGEPCVFDVLVSTNDDAGISAPAGLGLETNDSFSSTDPFVLQLDFRTEADNDGVSFQTAPGATVRVSALLYDSSSVYSRFRWSEDPRIISWVGNGALQSGAPTNPVDLTPDQP